MTNVMVVAIVGVVLLAPYAVQAQSAWIDAIQRRIVITVELVSGARGVKMSGLAGQLFTLLTSLRLEEISASKNYRSLVTGIFTFGMFPCTPGLLDCSQILSASTHSIVTPSVSFAIYMFVSRSKHGAIGTLDSPRAFTCLALLELMGESLLSLLQAISNISSAAGCIANIQRLLNKAERVDSRVHGDHTLHIPSQYLPPCLLVKNFSAGWQGPIVRNIGLDIPFDSLTMLVGPVGCGKSTLLQALLGETSWNEGSTVINSRDVAYCSQTPWLVNGTIRDNVLGPNSYCEDWYQMVIKACGLQVDIADLIDRDFTNVGTKGVALSGGQKQRLVGFLLSQLPVRQFADSRRLWHVLSTPGIV
jgi:ATP-binding cassette subfamily C (CFTR/MRP) protein 1